MRLVVVHNIIAPYRIPLFNLLSRHPDLDLMVLFMAESEPNRHWDTDALRSEIEFPFEVLRGTTLSRGDTHVHINPGLYRTLRRLRPDVILVTSLSLATAIAVLYRARWGARVVSWWAGTVRTESNPGMLRRLWRRLLIPAIDAFCCYSQASSDYLLRQGVPGEKLFVVGNVTFDAGKYNHAVAESAAQAGRWLEAQGLAGRQILLSVGQLIPRKNHLGLLETFREIAKCYPGASLVIVGDGPLRAEIEQQAKSYPPRSIILVGALPPREMPMVYSAADCFVDFTLRDHWSQVVGEAMAAGKACVVSTADHASELIEDGLSGYLVDPLDKECIVERTSRLLSSPDLAREMGRRGSLSVAARDVSYSAEMFMTALRSVLRPPSEGEDAVGLS